VCNQHKRKAARDYHSERAKVGSLTWQSQGLQSLYSKEEKANLENVLDSMFSESFFHGWGSQVWNIKNKMKPFGKESTIDVLGVLGCLHQLKIIHLLWYASSEALVQFTYLWNCREISTNKN